jgi:hypothetical protein
MLEHIIFTGKHFAKNRRAALLPSGSDQNLSAYFWGIHTLIFENSTRLLEAIFDGRQFNGQARS